MAVWLASLRVRAGIIDDLLAPIRRAQLSAALTAYCIPKVEETCESPLRACYQNGTCYCGDAAYMRYNAADRICEPYCPAGQWPEQVQGCDAGQYSMLVKEDC
jgi:hypothetical protein